MICTPNPYRILGLIADWYADRGDERREWWATNQEVST